MNSLPLPAMNFKLIEIHSLQLFIAIRTSKINLMLNLLNYLKSVIFVFIEGILPSWQICFLSLVGCDSSLNLFSAEEVMFEIGEKNMYWDLSVISWGETSPE